MTKSKILVVLLGGTITMTPSQSGGIVPTLGVAELVASVPDLSHLAYLEAVSMLGLPGASITLQNLIDVAALLRDRFLNGTDGAVVVQGTDTIEDTAFVLDLLIGTEHPVVVTGAMRAPHMPGADGPANLIASVRVACDRQAVGLGTVVVLNDEVHAARFVRKCHTALTNSFESAETGPVGFVTEGHLQLLTRPIRVCDRMELPRQPPCDVALISLGLSEDGRLLGVLPGLGYQGAVIEGVGGGHVPAAAVAQVAALLNALPVVLSTRVIAGPVFKNTYSFPGSEMDLLDRGVIHSGRLGASKSRLLLALLLTAGYSRAAISTAFAQT